MWAGPHRILKGLLQKLLGSAPSLGLLKKQGTSGLKAPSRAPSIERSNLPEYRKKSPSSPRVARKRQARSWTRKPALRASQELRGLDSPFTLSLPAMQASIQAIATPTADTSGPCFCVSFGDKRYLFGRIFEGLQRSMIERSLRLVKISDVFISGPTDWGSTGGLVGGVLSILDTQVHASSQSKKTLRPASRLNLHGSQNLVHSIGSMRRFIFRKGIPLSVLEHTTESALSADRLCGKPIKPSWEDHNLRVWALPVASATRKRTSSAASDRLLSQHNNPPAEVATKSEVFKDSEIRHGVVSKMFGSDWSLDDRQSFLLRDVGDGVKVFVRDASGVSIEYEGPRPGEDAYDEVIHGSMAVQTRTPWPSSTFQYLPETSRSDESVSYVAKTPPLRGRFLREKAISLGIKPGPMFSKLTSGHTVIAPDGTVVAPGDVLGPDRPGGGFALFDIPSSDFIDGLLSKPELGDVSVMDDIKTIIWNLGPGLHQNGRIREWRTQNPRFNHVLVSPDLCPNSLSYSRPAERTRLLSIIDSKIFPQPRTNPFSEAQSLSSAEDTENLISDTLTPMWHQKLIEGVAKGEGNILREARERGPQVPEKYTKLVEQIRRQWDEPSNLATISQLQQSLPGRDVELTTLGTGSMLPSPYRNVSGNLLRVPGVGSYIFDCGENTLGSLKRIYTRAQLTEIFRELRCIWISHHHADHHLGLISILKFWHETVTASARESREAFRLAPKPIAVISGPGMFHFFREYSQVEEFGFDSFYSVVPVAARPKVQQSGFLKIVHRPSDKTGAHPTRAELLSQIGLTDLQSVEVEHCQGAQAVSMTFEDGFKASYSGDCRPCPDFAVIGKDTTLLIHEATFDDDLIEDAKWKKHSTTSEALAIANMMQARRVVLTHFSQRYPKLPNLDSITGGLSIGRKRRRSDDTQIALGDEDEMHVAVAFDYMRIKVGEVIKIERFAPALKALFEEEPVSEQDE